MVELETKREETAMNKPPSGRPIWRVESVLLSDPQTYAKAVQDALNSFSADDFHVVSMFPMQGALIITGHKRVDETDRFPSPSSRAS